MSFTKEQVREAEDALMRRLHGDGINDEATNLICSMARRALLNEESCQKLMDELAALKADKEKAVREARIEGAEAALRGYMRDDAAIKTAPIIIAQAFPQEVERGTK